MKRTWAYDKDGNSREVTPQHVKELHYVQSDLGEFRAPDGHWISGGNAQWREHLKQTGTVEMGHSEMKVATEKWNSRKRDHAAKMARTVPEVKHADEAPILDDRLEHRSRLNNEIKNRLDGPPAPDRITLIKLTLEQERSLNRR